MKTSGSVVVSFPAKVGQKCLNDLLQIKNQLYFPRAAKDEPPHLNTSVRPAEFAITGNLQYQNAGDGGLKYHS